MRLGLLILPGTSGPVNVTLSGLMGSEQWVIIFPDTGTATSSNPQGWSVTADDNTTPTTLTVSVPTGAASGSYEVRWHGATSDGGFKRYSGFFSVP